MNEEERASQVSALFDCELEDSQSELVLRRIMKDPGLRTAWGRYAVIGASLRRDPLSVATLGREDLAARVASALAAEPELSGRPALAPHARRGWAGTAYKAVFGTALAASVAAASILVLRTQAVPQAGLPAMAATVQQPANAGQVASVAARPVSSPRPALVADVGTPAPSYTTPVTSGNATSGLPAPLVNYVVAHSEYLAPVMRINPLSAVMMGTFEPGEELVEATEAEIGATRH